MNNSQLAIKFSNEKYCSKKEVAEAMKTPLIDSIWNSVLEYRSNFSVILPLKHINNTPYSVCITPNMSERLCTIDRKLSKLSTSFEKIKNPSESAYLKHISYIKILQCVARRYGLKLDDNVIGNIVSGNVSTLSPDLMILNRYYQCLLDIEKNPLTPINDELLSKYYGLLIGTSELNKFYRTEEVQGSMSKTLIGKIYLGVPVNSIESNMQQLYSFLETSHVSMFIRALSAFYFIYYVKPFDEYTEEIATLVMKKVLALNDIGGYSALIDFEDLISNKEELENEIIESQKSFDLTYLVDYVLEKADPMLQEMQDALFNAQKSTINFEINQPEEKNILNKIQSVNHSNSESFKNIPSYAENTIPEHKVEVQNSGGDAIGYNQSIAISNLPTGLNEEEAVRLENHLMELNPSLSRGQAYFYARHCTLGMNYTISQYKKELGCAYETARSSMDHLVYLGYYRKELLKNKYIYTPVKKG